MSLPTEEEKRTLVGDRKWPFLTMTAGEYSTCDKREQRDERREQAYVRVWDEANEWRRGEDWWVEQRCERGDHSSVERGEAAPRAQVRARSKEEEVCVWARTLSMK